ncbi:protein phosphatase 2C domain-containing protein [Actinosynnema sp. NPDC023587]|uniref:protein phosphatase 2C domain-containing protein n=1 Tax=Actinosynnema sp. NPDC023587 TaxID=3154695 RepID=UPI00340CBDBA
MSVLNKVVRPFTGGGRRQQRTWRAAHLSTLGASHVRDGIVCQDYSDSRVLDDGKWAFVVVADGHGSERHFRSDRGAQLAVATMREVFVAFHDRVRTAREGVDPGHLAALWAQETGHVVPRWRAMVHADLVTEPPVLPGRQGGERGVVRFVTTFAERNGLAQTEQLFWQLRGFAEYAARCTSPTPEELGPLPLPDDPAWDLAKLGNWQAKAYGTTVLGVIVGPDSLHWIQLGDGALVQIVGGQASYLVPPPPEAIGNATPSLCDDGAPTGLRVGTVPLDNGHVPSAVVLTTDGVPNSYIEEAGFLRFCQDVAERARATGEPVAHGGRARSDFVDNLDRWLPEISRRGSGDDMSVALAWAGEVPTDHPGPDPEPVPAPQPVAQPAPQPAPQASAPPAADAADVGRQSDGNPPPVETEEPVPEDRPGQAAAEPPERAVPQRLADPSTGRSGTRDDQDR